jgi:hypothetical protein
MPVGPNAMDAITSGAGALLGQNADSNGNAPMTTTQAVAFRQRQVAYNNEMNAYSRATSSPFDIYNNATFLGSIAGDFVASMYSNGNSPLGIAQSLLGMFGSSLGIFANMIMGSNSAYAAASDSAYSSSCVTIDTMAADPFCNPIYGLPDGTIEDPDVTVANVAKYSEPHMRRACEWAVYMLTAYPDPESFITSECWQEKKPEPQETQEPTPGTQTLVQQPAPGINAYESGFGIRNAWAGHA